MTGSLLESRSIGFSQLFLLLFIESSLISQKLFDKYFLSFSINRRVALFIRNEVVELKVIRKGDEFFVVSIRNVGEEFLDRDMLASHTMYNLCMLGMNIFII